jgi:hypothetical protein
VTSSNVFREGHIDPIGACFVALVEVAAKIVADGCDVVVDNKSLRPLHRSKGDDDPPCVA